MKAYIYNADVYCEDCAKDTIRTLRKTGHPRSEDSDEWPQGPFSESENESDSPQHCGCHAECLNAMELADGSKVGAFLENNLTADGRMYVLDCLLNDPSEIVTMWGEFYGIETADEDEDDSETD